MRPQLPTLALLASLLSTTLAFSDTSPYLLLSSTPLTGLTQTTTHATTTTTFLENVKGHLQSCPSDLYILVTHPHLHARKLQKASYLKDLAEGLPSGNKWTPGHVVAENGVGTEDVAKGVENIVVSQCGAGRGETVREREGVFERLEGKKGVVRVEMSAEKGVEMNDAFLHALMETANPETSWTLILASSPLNSPASAADSASAPVGKIQELRIRAAEERPGNNTRDNRSLFEKYQFFTPAIFMGYTTMFFLIIVLVVAVRAVSGLEVSYGAFERDLTQQKKQQ